jgi:transcriptional regulator with XRE-family HTH domain
MPKGKVYTPPGLPEEMRMQIRGTLKDMGFTQREFAEHLGWSYAVLNDILTGKSKVTICRIEAFHNELDMPLEPFFKPSQCNPVMRILPGAPVNGDGCDDAIALIYRTLEERHISQHLLAKWMGMPINGVNKVLKGKYRMQVRHAIGFQHLLGIPAELLYKCIIQQLDDHYYAAYGEQRPKYHSRHAHRSNGRCTRMQADHQEA